MVRSRAKRKLEADGQTSTDKTDKGEEHMDVDEENPSDDEGNSELDEPNEKKAKPETDNDKEHVLDKEDAPTEGPNGLADAPQDEAVNTNGPSVQCVEVKEEVPEAEIGVVEVTDSASESQVNEIPDSTLRGDAADINDDSNIHIQGEAPVLQCEIPEPEVIELSDDDNDDIGARGIQNDGLNMGAGIFQGEVSGVKDVIPEDEEAFNASDTIPELTAVYMKNELPESEILNTTEEVPEGEAICVSEAVPEDEAPVLMRANTYTPDSSVMNVDNEDYQELPPDLVSYEPVEVQFPSNIQVDETVSDIEYTPEPLQPQYENVKPGDDRFEHEIVELVHSLCHESTISGIRFHDGWIIDNNTNQSTSQYYHSFYVEPRKSKIPDAKEVMHVPTIGNEAYPYLGDPDKGVYLSRRPDATLPTGFVLDVKYRMHIYKVFYDHAETVGVVETTNNTEVPLNVDSESGELDRSIRISYETTISEGVLNGTKDPFKRFLQNLIYIYEFDPDRYGEVVSQPKNIQPCAVVDFTVDNPEAIVYCGQAHLVPVGSAHVELQRVWACADTKQLNLGYNRPHVDFAIGGVKAEKSIPITNIILNPVFRKAITRASGDFENDNRIHIRHDVDSTADYVIEHTCFMSDDPVFSSMALYAAETLTGGISYTASAYSPDLKHGSPCCIDYIFPNCNALGLMGIPFLPFNLLHCLRVRKLQVLSTLCPLKTTKHEKMLYSLAPLDKLVRSDRISNNDVRTAVATFEQRWPRNREDVDPLAVKISWSNADRIDEELYIDNDSPTTSQVLSEELLRESFKRAASGNPSLILISDRNVSASKRSAPAMMRNNIVQNMARRVAHRPRNESPLHFMPQTLQANGNDADYRVVRMRKQKTIPAKSSTTPRNANYYVKSAVIFEPALFFESKIPVEVLDEVLSLTLNPDNLKINGELSIILHQHLSKAFETANSQPNGNMMLYASSFSKYRECENLYIQESHYCDQNPPAFRTFLICAQATLRKRKLDSLVVLSENAFTVDHAVYERNKVKILTPKQYIDAMYAGDNTILNY